MKLKELIKPHIFTVHYLNERPEIKILHGHVGPNLTYNISISKFNLYLNM